MGLLSPEVKAEMALLHGKLFVAECDICGKGILANTTYVVLKYEKRKWEGPGPKPFTWNLRVPRKIRCLNCNNEIIAEFAPKKKAVVGSKIRKKLSEADLKIASSPAANVIKHLAKRYLRKSKDPVDSKALKHYIYSRAKGDKAVKVTKGVIGKVLRILKKGKVLHYKGKVWSLVEGNEQRANPKHS